MGSENSKSSVDQTWEVVRSGNCPDACLLMNYGYLQKRDPAFNRKFNNGDKQRILEAAANVKGQALARKAEQMFNSGCDFGGIFSMFG